VGCHAHLGGAASERGRRGRQAGEAPAVLQAASGGNMHAFTAASSCAVLDLLAPPYDPRDRARPASGHPMRSCLWPHGCGAWHPHAGFGDLPSHTLCGIEV